jgi:hypothetical protein
MKSLLQMVMLLALPAVLAGASAATDSSAHRPGAEFEVVRFSLNPIIRPEMLPKSDGENINGPSLIRVPAWVAHPLGKYYLYFAHHGGKYIRLAYADRLEGPWRVYEPGTLRLEDAPGCKGHIASPDVVVDDEHQQIRLYFHGPAKSTAGQKTFVATSADGLKFKASEEILGIFYWRVFRWDGWWYAMAKGGLLYRSRDGLTGFEAGPNPFPGSSLRELEANTPGPRHVAVYREGARLAVYYSNIGDTPERILRCHIDLTGDWQTWKTSPPEEVIRPVADWEGARLPLTENALRDPAIFAENGRAYLLYSVAGESGLGLAEIIERDRARKP